MSTTKVTPAAGGVVWRPAAGSPSGVEVLLVHRPRYDDWTFPKGKTDQGETAPVTAAREIHEETGLKVRLGHPLPQVTYRIRQGVKEVSYWLAKPRGTSAFVPNDEVDRLAWLSPRKARKRLSYDHDATLLDRVEDLVAGKAHKTRSLVLLRHAGAVPRKAFSGPDEARPLTERGRRQARQLIDALAAYGIRTVISSPATRCLETIEPYLAVTGDKPVTDERLGEQATPAAARALVQDTLGHRAALLCSHRPLLPELFAALDMDALFLEPAQFAVVHHRKGTPLAVEHW